MAPVGQFEYLVHKQHLATGLIEFPRKLHQTVGLEKEVVLVGVASRVEIWSKSKWETAAAYDDMEEIAEHMAELGFGI